MQSKIDYKALPAKVSQQVLMLLDNNWNSFFKALKADEVVPREEGKASTTLQNNHQLLINESALPSSLNGSSTEAEPGKFLGRPKLPKYKDKIKGRNILVYTIQAISKPSLLKQQVVKLSQTNIEIRTVVNYSDLCQVRLVPKLNHYVIEVVHESKPKNLNLDKQNVVGIDLVLENLVTITSNAKGFKPLIINGKPLKSVNQFFPKKKADLQFIVKKGTTKRIQKICTKRNLKLADYLHKASRQILNLLVANNIGTLVIGKNNNWKQEISLGKKNNQGFTQIPHDRFIHMLKYKAE